MYIKILLPNGDWKILKADNIQYSKDFYCITDDEVKKTYFSDLPNGIYSALEKANIYADKIEIIHDTSIDLNSIYCQYVENQTPKAYKYFYAILDDKKALVFTTQAYILNDDGKTIAKIG